MGLTDVHAKSASVPHAELLPPEATWLPSSVLDGCARAQLRDLVASTEETRANVAQACTMLLMEAEVFIVLPAADVRPPHRARRGAVTPGRPRELPWESPSDDVDRMNAEELRTLMARSALASLHGYLSGRPERESPACSKVLVRYQLNARCQPSVHVTVTAPANDDVELAILRRMHRSLWAAREGLDCSALSSTLDGSVTLIPVPSGPAVSLLAQR